MKHETADYKLLEIDDIREPMESDMVTLSRLADHDEGAAVAIGESIFIKKARQWKLVDGIGITKSEDGAGILLHVKYPVDDGDEDFKDRSIFTSAILTLMIQEKTNYTGNFVVDGLVEAAQHIMNGPEADEEV